MKREASPLSISSLEHAERVHIGFEQRLLLLALVAVLLAQADNDTQCLDVKAVALGLGIDIANVVGDRFFLFLEPLDPLDKGFELILGKTAGGLIVFDGGSSSHWTLRAQFSQSRRQHLKLRGLWSSEERAHPQHCTGEPRRAATVNAFDLLFRTQPSVRPRRPSGVWRAIRHRACRRRSRGFAPWSSGYPWRRRHLSSSWRGSCGKNRPDSSNRCSARRCACASARPGGGRRRLRVPYGYFDR